MFSGTITIVRNGHIKWIEFEVDQRQYIVEIPEPLIKLISSLDPYDPIRYKINVDSNGNIRLVAVEKMNWETFWEEQLTR